MYQFTQKELHNLGSKSTSNFLKLFKISSNFTAFYPKIWNSLSVYPHGLAVVRNLIDVNDITERGMKLVEQFNNF